MLILLCYARRRGLVWDNSWKMWEIIVNLGLIYNVDVNDEGLCTVEMTLTSIGCPMGPQIVNQVKMVLAEIPEISDTEVNIVWSPPWGKEMMSRYAKIALGIG